ncbi:MAG: hypothetical protein B7Z55_01325 [Planctomycetales bacterium 12-60-4]|nr:MAG: hypothetical protein B7Z55_01325 [Planctomycetales bacterium 12-60-4]
MAVACTVVSRDFGWDVLFDWLASHTDPVAANDAQSTAVTATADLEADSAAPAAADWDDIRASIAGDGAAYGRLVARHQQAIARYLWRFTRDPQVHEELVQTVFVEAYFQLGTFAGRSPLGHWLQVIATRTGYRHWKLQSQQRGRGVVSLAVAPEPAVSPAAATPDAKLESAEAAALVHACLERLPPRDRLVLTLLHLEEKTVAEIAGLTGWSQTMVKVQAYRARGKLARLLKEPAR